MARRKRGQNPEMEGEDAQVDSPQGSSKKGEPGGQLHELHPQVCKTYSILCTVWTLI
jgi:hypothetical protein